MKTKNLKRLLAIAIVLGSSHPSLFCMEPPQDDSRENLQIVQSSEKLFKKFEQLRIEAPKNTQNPKTLTELILVTQQLRGQTNPNAANQIFKQAQSVYKQFKRDVRTEVKGTLFHLAEEFSEDEQDPYSILRKILVDANPDIDAKVVEKKAEVASFAKQEDEKKKAIEKLEKQIISLNATLERDKKEKVKLGQSKLDSQKEIEKGGRVSKILFGIAKVKEQELQEQLNNIEQILKEKTQKIKITKQLSEDSTATLEQRGAWVNTTKDLEQEIAKLEKQKTTVEYDLQRADNKFHPEKYTLTARLWGSSATSPQEPSSGSNSSFFSNWLGSQSASVVEDSSASNSTSDPEISSTSADTPPPSNAIGPTTPSKKKPAKKNRRRKN